ncbi:Putative monooxygenase [Roseovarius sp. THAF8]|uniref:putative quinol monooxygenase n=1 Tax=Roseovarius sp. THAF8 TaxID=2587846 RepID=UPI0012694A7A|nr:putative quinol monooxygenase [Roseovarius sp. THAF8]QFT99315.1 Putative monooxygenase [Roseovarius sp. THAF8]
MSLSIFATIQPKPDCLIEARDAILGILSETRAEAGCQHFTLHRNVDSDTLHLTEIWVDRAAFDAHHAQAYTRAVFERYEHLLAAPVELTFMHPLA